MNPSKFHLNIKTAVNEKDVENQYKQVISKYFSEPIISPYGSDGFIRSTVTYDEVKRKLLLIMEFKYDEDFNNSINIAKVLVQVLYYLKKFELDGETSPNVTLVGDRNETFVLHNNALYKYLDEKVDWKIAPSSAGENNIELVQKIFNDPEVNPFVFNIDENFKFEEVIRKIKGYAANTNRMVRVTEQNISTIYNYFITKVIYKYQDHEPNKLVSIFISLMLTKGYIHPNRNNIVVINDSEHIKVNRKNYDAYFSHFQQDYKPEERRIFTEIADRLIEETKRRSQGEYYTPTSFVEYSQSLLSKHLGNDWRNRFVVWDPAWGTGNLTRDYSFRNLYVSTLHTTDLTMGNKYNAQSSKFQYDFLNDDPELVMDNAMLLNEAKMPSSLLEHLNNVNTPILFYFNPPYATGGNANATGVEAKFNLAKSVVAEKMREDKLKVSEQLYAQFIYRIIKMKQNLNLENVYIGLFSPSLFLTGQKYKKFRELLLSEFEFVEGSIFKASHFADVKDTWAIDFSVWKSKDSNTPILNEFKHNVLSVNDIGTVEEIGQKTLWNLDNELTLQDWIPTVKEDRNSILIDLPCFSSSFVYSNKLKKVRNDSLGFFINDTNNIEATTKGCYLMASKISRNIRTITLVEENFASAMVAFTARNLFRPNWINQKDEFSAPNTSQENYKQFEVLSIVYSIFSSKNNVISYRDLEVNDKIFNWYNEWFFMSNREIRALANDANNDYIYNDSISNAGDRYVYRYLLEHENYLTEEAKELLNMAKKIIETTFAFRETFNYENEDKFLNTWDASWMQVKQLVRSVDANKFNLFNEKFKSFELELLERAVELQFLKHS